MVELEDVTFGYGAAPIFERFSWSIAEGEVWAVVGPSGCGKTTLLYLLAGLRRPQSGNVCVEGTPVLKPRTDVGLILQDHGLLPWATARQNAALGFRIRNIPKAEYASQVDAWLDRLGLGAIRDRYPGQLSGGQRQRVAIARTMALNPHLLLMDEPFSSLDALTRESLQDVVADLNRELGRTTILVTHSIEEAVFLASHIAVLGPPPNHSMQVLANPGAYTPGYRACDEYHAATGRLRRAVDAVSLAAPRAAVPDEP